MGVSPSQPNLENSTFLLDSAFIQGERRQAGDTWWGEIYLPLDKHYGKMVVEADLETASTIRRLHLGPHAIREMEGVEKLRQLRRLSWSSATWPEIPEWIADLPAIETLEINQSRLQEIPPAFFDQIPTLRQLTLRDSPRLRTIPTGRHLTRLVITQCENLESLPEDLFQHRLQSATLSGNPRLSRLPSPGDALTFLDASHCRLENLPWDLFHHRLATVLLNDNPGLVALPSLGPAFVSELTHLDVSFCDLETLSPTLFRHLLAQLFVSGNPRLQTLPSPGETLRVLHAAQCGLQKLPLDLFARELREVKLSGNPGGCFFVVAMDGTMWR